MIKYIIIILCIFLLFLYWFNNYENFTNNKIYFLSKIETTNFIIKDNDNYIKNMSVYDLYARKVLSHEEYINLIINECLDFTEDQKKIIYKCIDNNDLSFKIALINDKYEEGFPHTREDIIFLSPNVIYNTNLKKIIKHEITHIKQRYKITNLQQNYIISRKRNTEPLIRANPDLDEYIYKDINSGLELYYIYSSEKPNGINDIIKINNLGEHPFEIEAYEKENY
jgi:hypothetical protein